MSDTHNYGSAIERAVAAAGPVDMWLHAGDYCEDSEHLMSTGVPVVAVAGNCDGANACCKIDEFVEVQGVKIWLTHGHRYPAQARLAELAYWGRQYEVDVVIFGHSHVPEITRRDGLLMINPGSPTRPRGGSGPSCAVLDIGSDGSITASLVAVPNKRG